MSDPGMVEADVRGTQAEECGPDCEYCRGVGEAIREVRSWDWPWWRRWLDRVPGVDMDRDA